MSFRLESMEFNDSTCGAFGIPTRQGLELRFSGKGFHSGEAAVVVLDFAIGDRPSTCLNEFKRAQVLLRRIAQKEDTK